MSLPAGRELDALIAEKVMGWGTPLPVHPFWWIPEFSTTWEGMRLVVERMRELGWALQVIGVIASVEYGVVFVSDKQCSGLFRSATLPHAVCLAALEAVGGERK